MTETVLVFPGMHGSAELLEDFQRKAPNDLQVHLKELPEFGFRYPLLADHFAPQVESAGQCWLIGESFSGPLAVLLAARCENVCGVVLVASFVTPPTPWFAKFLPWSMLLRVPPSRYVVANYLLDVSVRHELVTPVRHAISTFPLPTRIGRMREVMKVDVREQLKQLRCPVCYLRPDTDWLVPKRCFDIVERTLPNVHSVEIHAPHLVLQRHPLNSWQEISAFFAGPRSR